MTKRLSKADLTAIRERAEKATKGRWYYEVDGDLYSDKTRDKVMYPYPKLLAEIERLQEGLTSTREMLTSALEGINDLTYEDLHT